MNFSVHNEKDNKKVASCTCSWMGKKGKNDIESLTGREKGMDYKQDRSLVSKDSSTLPVPSTITIILDNSITSLLVFQCHNRSSTKQPSF